jgi:quercetin dioxygenase-like cupin family protein
MESKVGPVMVSAFDHLGGISPQQLFEGIRGRALHGEHITLATVELDPGAVVAEHSHENEQLGIVLEGELTLRVGDEERTLKPGETWCIPSNVVHSGHAGPDGAIVIDVFSPPRADWQDLDRLEPGPPRWP